MGRAGRFAAAAGAALAAVAALSALAGSATGAHGSGVPERPQGIPLIEAHRGGPKANGRPFRPENTLSAFASSRTQGVRVEIDVRVAAGGVPVVFHDGGLAAATRRCSGAVRRKTPGYLSGCEVTRPRNLPGGGAEHNTVPTLSEVLSHPATRGVSWSLELKERELAPAAQSAYVRRVAQIVRRARIAHEELIVSSFSATLLRLWRREASARWPASRARELLLTHARSPHRPALHARRIGAAWVGANHAYVDATYLEVIRARRLRLAVWTPNSVDDIEEMARLGVDAIITDDPMRAKNIALQACLERGYGVRACVEWI